MKYSSFVKKCLVVVVALTALFLGTTPVKASHIVYNFYGTATGTLFAPDGVTPIIDFASPTAFSISIFGDTANIQSVNLETDPTLPPYNIWQNANLTGSIFIHGVMNSAFADLLTVFVDNHIDLNDPTNPVLPVVGFDNPVGTLFAMSPDPPGGLDTYDLKSIFGPTALAGAFVAQFAAAMATTGNILAIDSADGQFSAVPLPASFILLGTGLISLIGYRRSRNG
jgi:hypothetical protein